MDGSGNVYIADGGNNAIKELPRAFVPGGPIGENAAAGSDMLLPVVPNTSPLTGAYSPQSDQTWLTTGSVTSGVVPFSFPQNTGVARTAHLTVLGQTITVIQQPALSTSASCRGPWRRNRFGQRRARRQLVGIVERSVAADVRRRQRQRPRNLSLRGQ